VLLAEFYHSALGKVRVVVGDDVVQIPVPIDDIADELGGT
jgi:hypothetical protein